MLCLPAARIQKTSERCPRIWTDAGNTKRSLRKGGVETLSELAGYSKKEVLSVRLFKKYSTEKSTNLKF